MDATAFYDGRHLREALDQSTSSLARRIAWEKDEIEYWADKVREGPLLLSSLDESVRGPVSLVLSGMLKVRA